MSLTREQILAARKTPREKVAMPEWGGDVWVQVMSGEVRDEYEMEMYKERNNGAMKNMRARLLVRCLVDESGAPLFKPEDIAELGKESSVLLDRLAQVAQRLNFLTDNAMEKAKGNLEPNPGVAQ